MLDLRGNGGGLLREAVLVSSIFIEDGLITFTKGRTKPRREFEAEGKAIDGTSRSWCWWTAAARPRRRS